MNVLCKSCCNCVKLDLYEDALPKPELKTFHVWFCKVLPLNVNQMMRVAKCPEYKERTLLPG